jgi:hypothetical protein
MSGIAVAVRSDVVAALHAGFPELPLHGDLIGDADFLNILLFTDQTLAAQEIELNSEAINILRQRPAASDATTIPEQILIRLCGNGITDAIIADIKQYTIDLLTKSEISEVSVSVERQQVGSIEDLLDPRLLKKIKSRHYEIHNNSKVI